MSGLKHRIEQRERELARIRSLMCAYCGRVGCWHKMIDRTWDR